MISLTTALAIVFLIGAVLCALFSPLSKKIALRAGALAYPGDRHVHDSVIPSWGGLAIAAAAIIAIALGALTLSIRSIPTKQLVGVSLGSGLILIMGLLDDRFNIPARFKLIGQIAAAAILPLFGVEISIISNPFAPGWLVPAPWLGWILTVIWIVAVTNAINLIDGIDGLAAGVCSICCVTLAAIGVMRGQPEIALFTAALGGSTAGFLAWNFNPAKIFMGDSGAYFLGFMIGSVTILGAFKIAASIAIFVPLLVLAVPLAEVGISTLRRYLKRQPVFSADQEHLHHRLMAMGMSQRGVAILMYAVTTACGILAVWISRPK